MSKQVNWDEAKGYEITLARLVIPSDTAEEIEACLNCPFDDCKNDTTCPVRKAAKKGYRRNETKLLNRVA